MRERVGALIRIALGPAAAVVWLVGTAAWAVPGDLDTSFSGDGRRTVHFAGSSAALSRNGVAPAAGGDLDSSFGHAGKVTTSITAVLGSAQGSGHPA
jgi:hypothetical protein